MCINKTGHVQQKVLLLASISSENDNTCSISSPQHRVVRSRYLSCVAFPILFSLTHCTKKIQTCCHNPSRSSCWCQIFLAPSGQKHCAGSLTSEPDEPSVHCIVTLLPLSRADWIMSGVEKMVVHTPFIFFSFPEAAWHSGWGCVLRVVAVLVCQLFSILVFIFCLHITFCKHLEKW